MRGESKALTWGVQRGCPPSGGIPRGMPGKEAVADAQGTRKRARRGSRGVPWHGLFRKEKYPVTIPFAASRRKPGATCGYPYTG